MTTRESRFLLPAVKRSSVGSTAADLVRRRRIAASLSQFKLAALAGVSLQTVSLAERAGLLSPAMAGRLAAVLGCEVADLLGEEGGK